MPRKKTDLIEEYDDKNFEIRGIEIEIPEVKINTCLTCNRSGYPLEKSHGNGDFCSRRCKDKYRR